MSEKCLALCRGDTAPKPCLPMPNPRLPLLHKPKTVCLSTTTASFSKNMHIRSKAHSCCWSWCLLEQLRKPACSSIGTQQRRFQPKSARNAILTTQKRLQPEEALA